MMIRNAQVRRSQTVRPVRRALANLLLLGLLSAGCSEAERTTVFEIAASPHGDYALTTYVIEPWFPHGPHFIALDNASLDAALEALTAS